MIRFLVLLLFVPLMPLAFLLVLAYWRGWDAGREIGLTEGQCRSRRYEPQSFIAMAGTD